LLVKEDECGSYRTARSSLSFSQPSIRSCHRCSSVYHALRSYARTHARTHARTLRKRAKILSRGAACVYLGFPQFCTQFLPSHLAPAFADRQTEAIANFKDSWSGCLEWYRQYYHGTYLVEADVSSAAGVLGSACTQSRGLGQHSNGSTFIVEDRRTEQSAPRRCG